MEVGMERLDDPPSLLISEREGPAASASEAPHIIAGRAWIAIRTLYRAHGQLVRREGDHLELLLRTRWHVRSGFGSFKDFVREALQLSPRTSERRIALSRLIAQSPELAGALERGRLSPCQVLSLSPLRDAPDLASWITIAEDLTVRELEQLVSDYLSDLTSAEPAVNETKADEAGRRVAFAVPISAAVAWHHGMDMAQRVLGWEAPPYRCIEAILAETASGCDSVPSSITMAQSQDTRFTGEQSQGNDRVTEERPHERHPIGGREVDDIPPFEETRYPPRESPALNVTREQLETLQRSIQDAEEEIVSLGKMAGRSQDDPDQSIAALAELKRMDRRLRLLLAKLLRDADAANVFAFLGYSNITDFLVSRLKVSSRTAARFMSEAWTFEDTPELARAFACGSIGLGQAYLVNRVALKSTMSDFIRRAQTVTHLQFEREVRFLECLRDYVPCVAQQFHGPLPLCGLAKALLQTLSTLDWDASRIEEYVGDFDESGDPAIDPLLMRRLEALLEIVGLAIEEHDLKVLESVPTLAGQSNGDSTPRLPKPRTTISFWAPELLLPSGMRPLRAFKRCTVQCQLGQPLYIFSAKRSRSGSASIRHDVRENGKSLNATNGGARRPVALPEVGWRRITSYSARTAARMIRRTLLRSATDTIAAGSMKVTCTF